MPEPSTETAQNTADDFSTFEKSRNAGETPVEIPEKTEDASAKAGADKTAATESDVAEDTQEQDEPGTPGQGIDKRFKKLTTEVRELRAQLAAKAEPAKVTPEAATPPIGKPVAESFQTYEAFNEALMDWKLTERERVSAAQAATAKADTDAKTRFDAFVERANETRKVHADYDEVTGQEIPVSPVMHEILLESEHGPELAYWLGSNPDECTRISKLAPLAAAKALGVIEHGFAKEAPETPPKPKVSTAPKPPSTVGGRASSTKSIDDPDLDFREFEKRRNAAESGR